jgi:hypothetical protein
VGSQFYEVLQDQHLNHGMPLICLATPLGCLSEGPPRFDFNSLATAAKSTAAAEILNNRETTMSSGGALLDVRYIMKEVSEVYPSRLIPGFENEILVIS